MSRVPDDSMVRVIGLELELGSRLGLGLGLGFRLCISWG
jgi:hypothetical protein